MRLIQQFRSSNESFILQIYNSLSAGFFFRRKNNPKFNYKFEIDLNSTMKELKVYATI